MLSKSEVARAEPRRIEARVLDLIAETCGLERAELSAATPVAEALDSLTFVAIVARIEAVFDVLLGGDETSELLSARDVGELGRLLARKIDLAHANLREKTRNESC